MPALLDLGDTVSARFGPGESSLISCGDFNLTRQGDQILVMGAITHVWTDDGYNFDPGKSFDKEARILERHGKGKPFKWEARWSDIIDGELQIGRFLPRAGSDQNLRRRWLRFETHPGGKPDLSCGSLNKEGDK